MEQPQNVNAAMSLVLQQMKGLQDECPNRAFKKHLATVILPPTFNEHGLPVQGIWRESFIGEGCGSSRAYNIVTAVNKEGTVKRIPTLPGSTIADILLQKDGMLYAFTGATLALQAMGKPKCNEPGTITNTEFLKYEGDEATDAMPGRERRPWVEEWTVLECGTSLTIPIHFKPDATGTGITTKSEEIEARQRK